MEFLGYERPDGSVGVRNRILVMAVADCMDIDASTIIEGQESIETVGRRILSEIIEVASGKLTLGEALGYNNFSLFRPDPRLDALLGISQPWD